jgi:hypothetical protein
VRLTDLLGSEVVTPDGRRLGRVHDVRVVQDGPPIGPVGAALRVRSIIVGARALGHRLGFDRVGVRGPWPLKAFFTWLHRGMDEIAWSDVRAIEPRRIVVAAPASGPGPARADEPGRVLDVGLALLDRQLLDPDGRMAGKVDDLEFTASDDGPPTITAILAGPGALDRRLGGRLGRTVASVHERLQDRHVEGPARISFGVVSRIDQAVHLTIGRHELPTDAVEAWVATHVIERIPGAGAGDA